MSSPPRSDAHLPLPPGWEPPTTPEDVAALRRAREGAGRIDLSDLSVLDPPAFLPPPPPRRSTSEGWEPFRLPKPE